MKRPFEISERVYPFESKWIEIEGIQVHYLDEGEGPIIVLCHGNPSWSLLYVPMIKELKKKYRCIAIDYPGFGMSDTPPIEKYQYRPQDHSRILGAAIDSLIGKEKFSIFVQDWGGPIGLNAACDRHEQIERVFIGNTWAWPADLSTEYGQNMKAFSEKMGSDKIQEKIYQKNFMVNMIMGELTLGFKNHSPELVDELKAGYLGPFATPESRVGNATFPKQIMASSDWQGDLEKKMVNLYDKPSILFWGQKDRVFPMSICEMWQKRLTNYKLVLLPESGHFFQQDQPQDIVAAIMN